MKNRAREILNIHFMAVLFQDIVRKVIVCKYYTLAFYINYPEAAQGVPRVILQRLGAIHILR